MTGVCYRVKAIRGEVAHPLRLRTTDAGTVGPTSDLHAERLDRAIRTCQQRRARSRKQGKRDVEPATEVIEELTQLFLDDGIIPPHEPIICSFRPVGKIII